MVATLVPQVLSEIREHGGLKLAAVGKQFTSHGPKGVNPATVWRWARQGTRTPSGSRIRLEVVKVGMSWVTSAAAVDRFIMALTEANTPASSNTAPTPQDPAKVAARSARASARLAAMGC